MAGSKPPAKSRKRGSTAARPAAVEVPAPDPDPVLPAVNPAVDGRLAPSENLPFPIVAIGASAGGLEAIKALLEALPRDTGMAYVVVQHLSPTHESVLPEILDRTSAMPVAQVEDRMPVEPNRVYVIPPNRSLLLGDGMFQLHPRTELHGQQRPIDHFMRSLAEEQGHRAIGVVLSGTGTDGSLGVQEIKAAGGVCLAQDDSAEQTGMPHSAAATGAIDFICSPAQIAKELRRIAAHPHVRPTGDTAGGERDDAAMQRIFGLLRSATGVDFNGYKRATIARRTTRRMVLAKLETLHDYVQYLQDHPAEVDALYQDLLINVTSFFRNPESYEALKTRVFPALTEHRSRNEQVRLWALGCSTGEEAYSLAMAFTEYVEASGRRVPAQVFATDLNGVGIDKARAGVYTKGIEQDMSPERLRRFFVEVDGSYRIAKPIRDMCVFARQNVLADPPFSRLDFIACRNLLIYLEPALQQRLIPLLHHSLRAEGLLWLGAAETIGSYHELFDVVDPRHRIYAKKPGETPGVTVPLIRSWEARRTPARQAPATPVREPLPSEPLREADRALLARYAPPAVVVDEDLHILQFRGDTGSFLAPAPGRATLDLLKMLREGLLVAVRGAVRKARRDQVAVRETGLRVRHEGGWRDVDVEVVPLRTRERTEGFLVVFEEPAASLEARARQLHIVARATVEEADRLKDSRSGREEVVRLAAELAATREYLQSLIDQQETANAELQSANEEVQSSNEELQSINEEIETSKEEIQSSNEELATVNDELHNRNLQLSTANNDLTNLLASVELAIVMLGPDLRIRHFTPAAGKLFNLIPGDVGRPLSDITLNLEPAALESMARSVVESNALREREVQDREGRWYSLRVCPYRDADSRVDGVVVVLVDVDRIKQSEQALRESEARFEVLANSAPVLIWLADAQGCRFVNRAFEDFTGEVEAAIRHTSVSRFVHPDEREGFDSALGSAWEAARPFEVRARFRRADGAYRWMKTVGTPRLASEGKVLGFVVGTFDITDLEEAEAALVELDRGKNEFLAVLAHELRNPLSGVRNASRLLGETRDAAVQDESREIIDRQTAHMVRMVDDLLDVSRITHGKILLRRAPLELVALVRRVAAATAADRVERLLTFNQQLPATPVWVDGDATRIEQVLVNLLHNAAKFSRDGGRIDLALAVEPPEGGEARSATIHVRDNGLGIEPARLARVFELFVQGDHPRDHARQGMGLGLTLARRLVELHGGRIEALSAGHGMGSEFVVRLPLLPEAHIPRDAEAPTVGATSPPARRILIVDDDRDAARTMQLILSRRGHRAESVGLGTEALAAARDLRPDAILLDIGLPDIDGYEVARQLRVQREFDATLIVATTGYGRDEDVRQARAAGIDEHLTKPVDLDRLLDALARGRS